VCVRACVHEGSYATRFPALVGRRLGRKRICRDLLSLFLRKVRILVSSYACIRLFLTNTEF
jgi:hypothetical protein